jgi:hypothetical protein
LAEPNNLVESGHFYLKRLEEWPDAEPRGVRRKTMILTPGIVFLIAVAGFVAVATAIVALAYRRTRRSTEGDWEALLNRLTSVDRNSIAEVALDLIDESGQRRTDLQRATLDSSEIWKLVGGLEGVELLEANCPVLIELAFYLQRWYPEAVTVAEQLRLSARQIRWHVGRLEAAQKNGNLESLFAMYAQGAVVIYYMMTRQILALYEGKNGAMLAALEKAI